MKLFDYETYEDFGKEWFFQVLKFPKFALLDITVQWDDFGSDAILPEFSLCINSATLLAFFIRYKRFEFDLSVITARPRNLQWYRRNRND